MNTRSKYKHGLIILLLITLTGCGYRGAFVIENKTDKEVKIEFVFDTLNLSDIVRESLVRTHNRSNIDSATEFLLRPENETYLLNYFCDSLNLLSIYPFPGEFRIADLSKMPFNSLDEESKYSVSIWQNALSYYGRDSSLIKKVLTEKTITLYLPPAYTFYQICNTCGDCTCEPEFPVPRRLNTLNHLNIVVDTTIVVNLTENNFRSIMKKSKFDRRPSYVLKISNNKYNG